MIDEIYDNVLSLTNQIGYLDVTENIDPLRWSYNYNLNFNHINPNRKYPIAVLSYDRFFRTPFSDYIDKNGVIHNIY